MSLRSTINSDLSDVFFNVDDFNTSAVYDGATTVYGHFDNEYLEAGVGGQVGFESSGPMFLCKLADVPGVVHGKTLLIDSITYTVRGVQPDGFGAVLLEIEAPA